MTDHDTAARSADTRADPAIAVVPAHQGCWDDLQTVFGARGDASRCQCQHFKVRDCHWRSLTQEDRAQRLREQTGVDHPGEHETSGLLAYLDGEPVGWCAVEPRTAYPKLLGSRIPWTGRQEDKADAGVWAVTCFVTRTGFRRRGVSRALVLAAVDWAREHGAQALEGYPMITRPGEDITWGELYVGSRSIFTEAGFTEVSHPTKRRLVMRIDFALHGRTEGRP